MFRLQKMQTLQLVGETLTLLQKDVDGNWYTNEDAEERAREFFKDEWSNYDLDADGFLNALEFKHLVETISKKKLLLPECERFLAYIDKNGDNLLEIEELVTFIVKGMAINDNQRKAWKNKSPLHSKLLHFIDSVARVI